VNKDIPNWTRKQSFVMALIFFGIALSITVLDLLYSKYSKAYLSVRTEGQDTPEMIILLCIFVAIYFIIYGITKRNKIN